jgi:rod shape-determining protein MreC
MPVISDGGLVGVVAAVSRHYAVVNMLENVDCSVTAKIQRSRVDGVITWNGMTLSMKNVTKTRDVKTGDMVMTSEYSNILPPNIRIGIIGEVSDDPSSLFKIIRIAPGVDPVKLEEVFVMQVLPNQERTMLEQPVVPHPPVKSKKR